MQFYSINKSYNETKHYCKASDKLKLEDIFKQCSGHCHSFNLNNGTEQLQCIG